MLVFLLYPLALLPLWALYLLSDAAYFVVYVLGGYRKKVAYDNLKHAFPDKSPKELRRIMRKFYRNFFDQWVELLKLLTISRDELNSRISGNWEVFRELDREGINTYALLGHTFNWEWANVACQWNAEQQFAGVYMPVNSAAMNELMIKMRTRGGGWLISMMAKKAFSRLEGVRYIVGLIADQNPSNLKAAVWYPFMNREAPFFRGPEALARRAGAAVVFAGIKKIKRGHYQVHLELLTRNAALLPEQEVTRKYIDFMEAQLKAQPDNWLWTHRRWKYTKPQGV